jgi:hypothetical protein
MVINMVRFSIRRKPESRPQNQPPPEVPVPTNVAKTTSGDTSTSDEEPKGFAQAFAAHQVQEEERKQEESGFPYQEQVPVHT